MTKPSRFSLYLLVACLSAILLSSCTPTANSVNTLSTLPNLSLASSAEVSVNTYQHTDALERNVALPLKPSRVVSLFGSFAEVWELAGGTLVGVSSDALSEERIHNSPDAEVLGSNHQPNLELLLALEPELVMLSADLTEHIQLSEQLTDAGIAHYYLKIETFEDYVRELRVCTMLTDRDDLYKHNGTDIQADIDGIRALLATQESEKPLVLLLRAMGSGAKAKAEDIMAGAMLQEMGAEHLASRYPSLLDDLSMEIILQDDPEYLFVLPMGDTEKSLAAFQAQMDDNPAWQSLTAVAEDRLIVLPKDLFHFKPNARWGEAYVYLANILYPGLWTP